METAVDMTFTSWVTVTTAVHVTMFRVGTEKPVRSDTLQLSGAFSQSHHLIRVDFVCTPCTTTDFCATLPSQLAGDSDRLVGFQSYNGLHLACISDCFFVITPHLCENLFVHTPALCRCLHPVIRQWS